MVVIYKRMVLFCEEFVTCHELSIYSNETSLVIYNISTYEGIQYPVSLHFIVIFILRILSLCSTFRLLIYEGNNM